MPEPENLVPELPTIAAPELYDRNDPEPPAFTVWPGSNSFFAVEVSTDPRLFDQQQSGDQRTRRNFWASWPEGLIEATGKTVCYLPIAAWMMLREANGLYYRVLTSSSGSAWVDYQTSLPLANLDQAPFLPLRGRFTHLAPNPYPPEEDLWRREPQN